MGGGRGLRRTAHGVDPRAVRPLAVEVLAAFAGARVQAFVPILVEKRRRQTLCGRSSLGAILVEHSYAEAVTG